MLHSGRFPRCKWRFAPRHPVTLEVEIEMNEILTISGIVLAGFALRTYASVWLRRVGAIAILYASYRVGVALFDTVWAGWFVVSLWFLIPVVQVMTMARALEMPVEKRLLPRRAPPKSVFPELGELTEEFESAGFELGEDIGWEAEIVQHYSRLFIHPGLKLQGSLHLNTHYDVSMSFVMLTTRTADGRQWTSWNYPLSYGMKLPPSMVLNRVSDVASLAEMMQAHAAFTSKHVQPDQLLTPDPERLLEQAQDEMRHQIDHNLDMGLLKLAGEGTFAYSWRGCLFMLRQYMIDLVRLS